MPKRGTGLQNDMTPAETAILQGFITANKKEASDRTRAKVRHFVYKMVATLHSIRPGVTLDTASYDDLAAIPAAIRNQNGEPLTKNSRQSFVTTLKALVAYMEEGREMKIAGKKYEFSRVKGGAPSRDNKVIITPEDFQKVTACRMSTKERAILALMWDGCLRPGEPLVLKWSDFKIDGESVSYKIRFKTEKTREILMSQDAKAILEEWRRASRRDYGEPVPVFPDRCGNHYTTIEPVVDLFKRLRKETGFNHMTPGCIRNSAITRDCTHYKIDYICRRCWGEPYNDMVNIYVSMAETVKMQRMEQERVNGKPSTEDTKPKVITRIPCPHCGASNPEDGVFCSVCGRGMKGDAGSVVERMEKTLAAMQEQLSAMQERYRTNEAWRGKPGQSDMEYFDGLRKAGYEVQEERDGSLRVKKR